MNRFKSFVSRKSSSNDVPTNATTGQNTVATTNGESPEADVARGVRLFCESGGPNNTGEEVLHLPVIVDAAESSPAAAKEAAHVIRKFLGKNNFMRAYVQYNAIMLLRILADNPGPTFTRNLDSKFIATVKELLRDGRDMSVQQILRETLDIFELQKADVETLRPLITMWQNEKTKWAKRTGNDISSAVMQNHRSGGAPPFTPGQHAHFPPMGMGGGGGGHSHHHRHHSRNRLPPPHELASRIEEARTSGKLLTQVVQSTPQSEILSNDLIKEFAERCREASRSMQAYINAENPAPDEDTLLTLIETNDVIAAALSRHQHALLNARKAAAGNTQIQGGGGQTAHSNLEYANYTSAPPVNGTRIPGPGAAPLLSMPKPPERIQNPFDDSNRSEGVGDTTVAASDFGYNRQNSQPVARGQQQAESDDESPVAPRQYRF